MFLFRFVLNSALDAEPFTATRSFLVCFLVVLLSSGRIFPVLSRSGEHDHAVEFEGQTRKPQQGTNPSDSKELSSAFGPNWVISPHAVNKLRKKVDKRCEFQRAELIATVWFFLSRERCGSKVAPRLKHQAASRQGCWMR